MWQAYLRSKEFIGNELHLIVDFASDTEKFSEEFVTSSVSADQLSLMCEQRILQRTDLKTLADSLVVGAQIKLPAGL